MLIAVLVLVGLIALILPPFIARLTDLGSSLQEGVQRVAYSVGESLAGMDRAEVDRQLETAVDRVRERLGGTAMAGATSARRRAGERRARRLPRFFLVKDGRRMWIWLVDSRPTRRREAVDEVGGRVWTS